MRAVVVLGERREEIDITQRKQKRALTATYTS
jgi:hypothetical protein